MGRLVAFEAIGCAGKSSVIGRLAVALQDCKVALTVCGELRSPLASVLCELLRSGGSPFLKTFLFACDRAWSYEKVGLPALQRGDLVLWDRYVDSALAYRAAEFQFVPCRLDIGFVRFINQPFREADLTGFIDIGTDVALQRARLAGKEEAYDRAFPDRVRVEYLKLATAKKYCRVDGEQPLELVVGDADRAIRQYLRELFEWV